MNKYILLLFITCYACGKFSPELKFALQYSGENRKELEKTLEHYSRPEDSLKYKAAVFLIENMPGQFSYVGKALDRYYENADSIFTLSLSAAEKKEKMDAINQEYRNQIKLVEDIKIITSDFLIQNIEKSFKLWNEKNWTQPLSFKQFCEYILPYKVINNQPLEYWKDTLYNKFEIDEELFQYCNPAEHSTYFACLYVNIGLKKTVKKVSWDESWFPVMKAGALMRMHPGTCDGNTLLATMAMRSNGIPIVRDFTPQWPNRGLGHSWNVLFTHTDIEAPFSGIDGRPDIYDQLDGRRGKVFRNTYAINRKLLEINIKNKHVPKLFKNIALKDVTAKYSTVHDLKIPIVSELKRKDKYVWISYFMINDWNPIHWGEVKGKNAIFKDMPMSSLYLAGYYTDKGIIPLSYPFKVDYKGEIHYFIPDTTRRQTLFLKRKYPIGNQPYTEARKMIGGCIQASNDPNFKKFITIDSITTWPEFGSVPVKDTASYRYWRYLSPPKDYCTIAELFFFDENASRIKGEIIGKDSLDGEKFDANKVKAFDEDPLTYFRAKTPYKAWIGVDFGKPERLSRIIYIPRTDDNNIRIGDTYELFYWDIKEWRSLGKKKADDIYLIYENAPVNALFRLRDLTRGRNECPFAYENEKQIW